MSNKRLRDFKIAQRRPIILAGTWKTNANNTTWFTGGDGMILNYVSDGYSSIDWADGYYSANLGTFVKFNSSSNLNVEDGYATLHDADENGCIVKSWRAREPKGKYPTNIENGEVSIWAILSLSRHDKAS